MKKMLFICGLLLAVVTASAQFNFGIKAGYNSSLSFDNLSDVQSGEYNLSDVKTELSSGFHAGAFVRLNINKVYLQPELLYNMQKKDYRFNIADAGNLSVDKFVRFSTVDIPVLLGVKLLDLKVANLRVFAGPKFRLNAGSEVSYENLDNATINTSELEGDFKDSTVGLEAGAGIDVLMLSLDFRFNMIKDIYQTNWQSKPDSDSKFVISLGWKLF